jgi:protein involved in polysaccharide export with SLBB domain
MIAQRVLGLFAVVFHLAAAPAPAQVPAPAAEQPVMLLPGDAIKLTVWRQEDMTGEFQINESGVVTLPLLGPRKVTGVPIAEARESLYQEFRAQLRNPSIEITPLRRVYVLGEVNKPGALSVDPTITLAGAVALAEGPTQDGDLERIRVIRGGSTVLEQVGAGATLAAVDVRSGDQIFIGQRSWIERNTMFLVNLVVSLAFTAVNLALR